MAGWLQKIKPHLLLVFWDFNLYYKCLISCQKICLSVICFLKYLKKKYKKNIKTTPFITNKGIYLLWFFVIAYFDYFVKVKKSKAATQKNSGLRISKFVKAYFQSLTIKILGPGHRKSWALIFYPHILHNRHTPIGCHKCGVSQFNFQQFILQVTSVTILVNNSLFNKLSSFVFFQSRNNLGLWNPWVQYTYPMCPAGNMALPIASTLYSN